MPARVERGFERRAFEVGEVGRGEAHGICRSNDLAGLDLPVVSAADGSARACYRRIGRHPSLSMLLRHVSSLVADPFLLRAFTLSNTTDRPRRSRQRSPSPHRADDAGPLGQHRRLADARLAARDAPSAAASRTSSSTCSSRARRRGRPRTSRRRSTRSAASSTRSPPRNTPATTSRCSTSTCRSRSTSSPTSSCNPAFSAGRHRAREEGRPRRDQDGRGHARRSRPRAVHAGLLGGPSARPADSRHAGDGRVVQRRRCCATTSATPTPRRT